MALSDYSTDVEKIAALKAATLDPALVQVKTRNTTPQYTISQLVYIFYAEYLNINDCNFYDHNYIAEQFLTPLSSGDVLSNYHTVMFVNDDDIVYNNPIDTYQSRLSHILSTIPTRVIDTSFTTGVNGSIITFVNDAFWPDGSQVAYDRTQKSIPIPSGIQIDVTYGTNSMAFYFDVPSDW